MKISPVHEENKAISQVNLSASRLLRVLNRIIVVLLILSFLGWIGKSCFGLYNMKGFIPMFNVDLEYNVPSAFSYLLLLSCGLMLILISIIKYQRHDRFRFNWALLAFLFMYIAVDEIAELHEKLIKPLRASMHTSGVLYFAWVIPGLVLVLVLAVIYFKFFFALSVQMRKRFFIAGLMYVGGAVGGDLVGGNYIAQHIEQDLVYGIMVHIEEGLEMFGAAYFLATLLLYYRAHIGVAVQFNFES